MFWHYRRPASAGESWKGLPQSLEEIKLRPAVLPFEECSESLTTLFPGLQSKFPWRQNKSSFHSKRVFCSNITLQKKKKKEKNEVNLNSHKVNIYVAITGQPREGFSLSNPVGSNCHSLSFAGIQLVRHNLKTDTILFLLSFTQCCGCEIHPSRCCSVRAHYPAIS